MHVPAILRAPGFVKPGQVWDRPVISMDLTPTLLGMADPAGKPPAAVDGQNILPVLAGKAKEHDFLFWSFEKGRAVRNGDWKLLYNPPQFPGDPVPEKIWLSNLESDPGEKKNVASANPERVKDLMERLRAWEHSVGLTEAE